MKKLLSIVVCIVFAVSLIPLADVHGAISPTATSAWWEQTVVGITPTSLSSSGGQISALIATDEVNMVVSPITLSISGPGLSQSVTATQVGYAVHTTYVSRGWKAFFNIPANTTDGDQTYTVTAISSQISGTPTGSVTVSNSGSTQHFGYSFNNWHSDVTTDGMEWLLQHSFDLSGVDIVTQDREAQELMSHDIFGGLCYGMSASALMEAIYPEYDSFLEDSGKQSLYDFPQPSMINGDYNGTVIGQNPQLDHIEEFQLYQRGQISGEIAGGPSVWNTLKQSDLTNGVHDAAYILNFVWVYTDLTWPYIHWFNHEVVPIGWAPDTTDSLTGDSISNLLVYDPNYPGKHQVLSFEGNGSVWTYSGYHGNNLPLPVSIKLTPISSLYNGGNRLRLEGTGPGNGAYVQYTGSNLYVEDSSGNVSGFKNGDFFDDISNVSWSSDSTGDQGNNLSYTLSSDQQYDYVAQNLGSAPDPFSVTKFGNGYFVDLDGILQNKEADIRISQIGTDVSFNGLTSENSLTIHKAVAGTEGLSFVVTDAPYVPSVKYEYSINWTALSQGQEGVTVRVDTSGDGIFDKTFTCGSTLTADEFNLKTETAVNLDPNTLNLETKGKVVTAYIQLPVGYDPANIDVSTIKLNGQVLALSKPTSIGDYNHDGIPDLMVKFDRSAVQDILSVGDNVTMTVTGQWNGTEFEGQDHIKVIK